MKIVNRLLVFMLLFNPCIAEEIGEISEVTEEIIEELKIKNLKDINKANVAIIQALNKITAKTYKHKINMGETIIFERLSITPLFCWKSSPEEVPENKLLLRIVENKLDNTKETIFYGWMFSSSPGISSLEHPMYDITVVDCKIEISTIVN